MKWFLGALALLLTALILQSGLLAYSMYVLLAVLILSRVLARAERAAWGAAPRRRRAAHGSGLVEE